MNNLPKILLLTPARFGRGQGRLLGCRSGSVQKGLILCLKCCMWCREVRKGASSTPEVCCTGGSFTSGPFPSQTAQRARSQAATAMRHPATTAATSRQGRPGRIGCSACGLIQSLARSGQQEKHFTARHLKRALQVRG